jgi:16S rRNA (guanine966-N2)-methyltransferase
MRVISGKAKGRKLASVPGDSTRPITDRVKESLFNILGADIRQATFLDLFAGTGSVGIEALSRDAKFVLFIDRNRKAVKTVHANLALTQLAQQAQVLQDDAFSYLEGPQTQQFDYIYIAPPQYKGLWLRALKALDAQPEWLSPDAWVIVQIHPRELTEFNLEFLIEFDRRTYGSTVLLFFERKTD